MRTILSNTFSRKGEWALRVFWLALVAVHVAPLLALVRHCQMGVSAELVGKIAGILASIGFFGLKAAGAGFLRIQCRWTGIVVFLTVAGLVHQGVREEIAPDDVVPIVAVACVAAAVPAILRRSGFRVSIMGSGQAAFVSLLNSDWRKLIEMDPAPRRLYPALAYAVPRGPPAF